MSVLTIQVKVRTRSKERGLTVGADGVFSIRTPQPPEQNKANLDVLDILADHFQVSRSQVVLQSGQSSRQKKFQIIK
jgi:hypothetical protein